jgi:hypothetical protein
MMLLTTLLFAVSQDSLNKPENIIPNYRGLLHLLSKGAAENHECLVLIDSQTEKSSGGFDGCESIPFLGKFPFAKRAVETSQGIKIESSGTQNVKLCIVGSDFFTSNRVHYISSLEQYRSITESGSASLARSKSAKTFPLKLKDGKIYVSLFGKEIALRTSGFSTVARAKEQLSLVKVDWLRAWTGKDTALVMRSGKEDSLNIRDIPCHQFVFDLPNQRLITIGAWPENYNSLLSQSLGRCVFISREELYISHLNILTDNGVENIQSPKILNWSGLSGGDIISKIRLLESKSNLQLNELDLLMSRLDSESTLEYRSSKVEGEVYLPDTRKE